MVVLIIVHRLLSLRPNFSRFVLQSFLLARVFTRLQFPQLRRRRGCFSPTHFGLGHHAQAHVVLLHLPHRCTRAASLWPFGLGQGALAILVITVEHLLAGNRLILLDLRTSAYVFVRIEYSVAVLFEHDALEVIARIGLVVYQLGIVEGLLLLVAVTVVVVNEQEDAHVTEEGQLHGLLQKTLLALAVRDLGC